MAELAVDRQQVWKEMERAEAVDWLKRAPYRSSDQAAARGSDIHDWAEGHILGHAIDVEDAPPGHRGYIRSFLQFLDDWQPEYEATEATVYNREHGYAGTLDALMRIPGLGLCLVDYKTGKGVYGEVALQLAAYRYAEFIGLPDGTEEPMPDVDWCGVLHLRPQSYAFVPVAADEEALQFFLYAQQVRYFLEEHSRTVLGPPMRIEEFN